MLVGELDDLFGQGSEDRSYWEVMQGGLIIISGATILKSAAGTANFSVVSNESPRQELTL